MQILLCNLQKVNSTDERFILFPQERGRLFLRKIISIFETDGFTPNITQEAPQWTTVINLVAAGMGVSLAPLPQHSS
jgi:DNA-binding transcriptional LysR family regulator